MSDELTVEALIWLIKQYDTHQINWEEVRNFVKDRVAEPWVSP